MDTEYERDSAADWPMETQRFKNSQPLVSRDGRLLRLAIDGGKAVELIDCPYGDDSFRYLYERYDQAGAFHVVRRIARDDLSYRLVLMRDGTVATVYGLPIWASEKTRFLTIACSLEPPRGALAIQAPAGESLATEAEFPLPCERESCSARWDHQTWISVSCVPRDEPAKRGSEFVLVRGNNGAWNKFGR
ncbi:MAG: hypothetical protein JOY64_16055 [Alphaproteobacteria bacterium]|nr:hypothetical protein [Alphaproteobacteria bacterium]MBV8409144.1 hypothetical protein [Alphaproteobacteria bacterium]